MSDRDALLALAERCERATGADRELDDAIATVVFRFSGMSQLVGVPLSQQFRTFTYANGSIGSSLRYTDSLDAAMTLVPDNAAWELDVGNGGPDNSGSNLTTASILYGGYRTADARTPALALIAVALRARAANA